LKRKGESTGRHLRPFRVDTYHPGYERIVSELIFGLVGAIGTELGQVEDALKNALASVGYIAVPIKLSDLMRELNSPWSTFPGREDPEYYEKAMDAGNKLREKLQDAGVLANLAIASIRRRRDKAGAGRWKKSRIYPEFA
jgi:hypothetical protein